jgi:hypothetical protein
MPLCAAVVSHEITDQSSDASLSTDNVGVLLAYKLCNYVFTQEQSCIEGGMCKKSYQNNMKCLI